MARYQFQVHDRGSTAICAIYEIENTDDVRREAVRQAAAQLFDPHGTLKIPDDWSLDVVDEAGQIVFRLVYPCTVEQTATGH